MKQFCVDCEEFLDSSMFDDRNMKNRAELPRREKPRCKFHVAIKMLDKRAQSYNIDGVGIWRLAVKQEGMCDICNSTFVPWTKFHIDHCHATGKVRGLLCHNCNIGLGNFKDSKESLSKAIKYLDKE